jgi:hypothetical protein
MIIFALYVKPLAVSAYTYALNAYFFAIKEPVFCYGLREILLLKYLFFHSNPITEEGLQRAEKFQLFSIAYFYLYEWSLKYEFRAQNSMD